MRFTLLFLLTFSSLVYANDRDSLIQSKYADLGEVSLHYKVAGTGVPIIFLHGGTSTSDSWEFYLRQFSDTYQAIAIDGRGQGQSTKGKGPLTYGRMAGDVVQLMDYLNINQAHIVGHSDGGVVALHLLVDYSDRIHSATLLGTPYHINNYPEYAKKALEEYVVDLAASKETYEVVKLRHSSSKKPNEWIELVDKWRKMWRTQPTFSLEEIGLITTPVLVVKTDKDYFIPSDVFDRMAKQMKDSEVLHIPEGTHSVYRKKSEEVSKAIRAYIQKIDNNKKNN